MDIFMYTHISMKICGYFIQRDKYIDILYTGISIYRNMDILYTMIQTYRYMDILYTKI